MSALPVELNLGGCRAAWVWATADDPHGEAMPRTGAIPAGLLVDHDSHSLLISWVPLELSPETVTLESLNPLTIRETVRCIACDRKGMIKGGAWLAVGSAVSDAP